MSSITYVLLQLFAFFPFPQYVMVLEHPSSELLITLGSSIKHLFQHQSD